MKLPSREAGIETVKGLWSAPLREPWGSVSVSVEVAIFQAFRLTRVK